MGFDCGSWWQFCLSGKTPALDKVVAIILGIVNIIFPGIGIIIGGAIEGSDLLNYVFIFLIQFFLCWLVVPWVWAIALGVRLIVCPGQ